MHKNRMFRIKEIEDAIPSIDSIIMNPRRFIVQEEDVVRIEKTKKVTLESIKDLAIHTNYIQEVDEDGFVKPIKLLNVFILLFKFFSNTSIFSFGILFQ